MRVHAHTPLIATIVSVVSHSTFATVNSIPTVCSFKSLVSVSTIGVNNSVKIMADNTAIDVKKP